MLTQWRNAFPIRSGLDPEPHSQGFYIGFGDFDRGEYERIRQSGRERLLDLSRPKEIKIGYFTNVGPNVMWGTQEMLWPVNPNIQKANDRVEQLATPKKDFSTTESKGRPLFYYSCGRPSMIWEAPPKNLPEASQRVQQLAEAKPFHPNYKEDRDILGPDDILKLFPKSQFFYSCGRESPIWTVTKGAKSAGERPRTNQLAAHRPPVKEFQPARQIETIIPGPALTASASERLQALATPKNRSEGPFRPPQWPVLPAAKNASAKARSVELARPRGTTDGYMLPKDEIWPISRAAKRATASGRVNELSKPVVRASMDHVQFNPEAFIVKETALKGVIPKRVFDLANPITR
ncbi:sperm microtubule associated protein 2-like isoform X1 [Saccostrea echinata]|uniref:sperm microtubule associated protein 2-like isoform X1 n=1 Tax=Saccostrea echinata TaxID=191078 RepID=UPI002A806655|nr:sperm microtubule associated protein 2-like isoform X1 [Saccostrea echinata]